ncbi:hypothetical protein [Enterococcus phage vB_Efs6_KEN16]|uniref:Uncharacterized protein n=1 Tax=Enterococcus phage vB_Efs6_KEN16 TaxID=3138325 RepID=A0AAX4PSM8_9CAUD
MYQYLGFNLIPSQLFFLLSHLSAYRFQLLFGSLSFRDSKQLTLDTSSLRTSTAI